MEFNTKQELYTYLNNFDFKSVQDTRLSSVYFLVEFDNHRELVYFAPYEDVWSESACELFEFVSDGNEIMAYIEEIYSKSCLREAYEYEKNMQKDGRHYQIINHQCLPFLPNKIKIIDVFSDKKALDWLLNQSSNRKSKRNTKKPK